MAFDFGLRQIGVAVGNTALGTSQPLAIQRAKEGQPSWDAVAALLEVRTRDLGGAGACPAAWAAALRGLAEDPEGARRLTVSARERVATEYTRARYVAGLESAPGAALGAAASVGSSGAPKSSGKGKIPPGTVLTELAFGQL